LNNEDVSRRSIAMTMKAGKLTARGLAYCSRLPGGKSARPAGSIRLPTGVKV